MTITQALQNRDKQLYTPFRIYPDGSGFYLDNDMPVPRKKFEKKYPTPMSFVSYNGHNADKTKSWMIVE